MRPHLLHVAVQIGFVRHDKRGADEAILKRGFGDCNTRRSPGPSRHKTLRRGADDTKAEVAPEALSGRQPAFLPAQEGQLDRATKGWWSWQSLDISGEPAFGVRLGLPKYCGGASHRWASLQKM